MLHIICAEEEEAQHLNIKNAEIHITGVGLYNVLKSPRIDVKDNDLVLNIGYAGSNVFKPGEIFSVCSCERFNSSNIVDEKKQYLYPFLFLGAECYTADDFVTIAYREVPLIDMELYYLSLIYPTIRAIKIISDNLDYKDYKKANLIKSWDKVNKEINKWIE